MKPAEDVQTQIRECLAELGISSPVDWDVLVYLYQHRASLTNSEQISRVLGYPSAAVGDSLRNLESLKLIRRSRAPRGVSIYRFISPEAAQPPHNRFPQLMALVDNREGRLHITRKLQRREIED